MIVRDYRYCIMKSYKEYWNFHAKGLACWCNPVERVISFEDGEQETWILHRNYEWDGSRWIAKRQDREGR